MGVVYSAEDPTLGRSVAIKMIHRDTRDVQGRERLRREARLLASVNHPNICQVYEIGEEQDDLYIVMELLEGEPLADRIARSRATARRGDVRSGSASSRRCRRFTSAASCTAT